MLSTFTRPGEAYLQRVEDIKINLTLKKLHTIDTLEETIADTTSRLNTETTADTELLESLIATQVTSRTKNLNSKLGQLRKQLTNLPKADLTKTAKKTPGGAARNLPAPPRRKKEFQGPAPPLPKSITM